MATKAADVDNTELKQAFEEATKKAEDTAKKMAPKFLSISLIGLKNAVKELSLEAVKSEEWRRRTKGGKRVTSHDLRRVFTNRIELDDKTAVEVLPGKAPFHPHDRCPKEYSEEEPDGVITYAWSMCLVEELPRFLDPIDEELKRVLGREPRCQTPAMPAVF